MSADPPPLVVVDTNVLLAATDLSRDHHGQAVAFLTTDERYLAVTPQIMREYLAHDQAAGGQRPRHDSERGARQRR